MFEIAALLLLSAASMQEPAARWALDGDAVDAGPSRHAGKIVGQALFIDSPVGGSGKTLSFNGVDTIVEVTPRERLGAGEKDFTVSLWVLPLEARKTVLVSREGAWGLHLLQDGSLQFESTCGSFKSPAHQVVPGEWHHVAVEIRRPNSGDGCKWVVNGAAVSGGQLGAGDLDPAQAKLLLGGLGSARTFNGLMDDVRVYAVALETDRIRTLVDDGLPWVRPKAHAQTPFAGKFSLEPNDGVVTIGGENALGGQEAAYLEALLSIHARGKGVRHLSMAWEGDTVHGQWRVLNFGSWSQQLRRAGATVLFVHFGQIESLEGKAGLDRFIAAYDALIAEFAKTTRRIVLLTPVLFEKPAPPLPDLSTRNGDVRLYAGAIRELAAKHGLLAVDLLSLPKAEGPLTREGLHLTEAGHWAAAAETARQLEIAGVSDLDAPRNGGPFRRAELEAVRTEIREKHRLWLDYWRPTNWAFLNGDRMEQPSSRDHQDRRIRWYPVEVQQLPALIRRQESIIEKRIEAVGR